MAAFRFAAVDNVGKESSGVLEADSARLARQLLRGRGLIPLSVDPVMTDVGARAGGLSLTRRLSQTELAVITRQLASLLGAQLPVADALTVMVEQSEKQSVRELMASIRTDVLGGTSLSKALVRHPRQFPDIYRALISAGEESGKLGSVLGSLADYVEERAKLQQKITLAFVYPAIVTFVALAVVIGLLTYVVPNDRADRGIELRAQLRLDPAGDRGDRGVSDSARTTRTSSAFELAQTHSDVTCVRRAVALDQHGAVFFDAGDSGRLGRSDAAIAAGSRRDHYQSCDANSRDGRGATRA